MTDDDRRHLYTLGHTDIPDRLAPARALVSALVVWCALLTGTLLTWWLMP